MAPPPRTRTRGKKLPPGAGTTKRSNAIEKTPHVLEPETELDRSVSMEVDQETASAKAWIQEHVQQEVDRIRATGATVEPLAVKNFGIVVDLSRKKAIAINRIEIDTSSDFKKVEQIMVSPGVPYPHKENFEYVNVLLFASSTEAPMLVPYLYDTKFRTQEPTEEPQRENSASVSLPSMATAYDTTANQRPWINVKNNLTEWLLVNAQHMRARHHIDEFHDI
ncbi:hypothetical protein BC939DRAFT_489897 [Gamsiella multidivaricata]|uniref:uncharacterized protein n=1 Tax=Gamsiella multidivaricata TaxID=101098 RepID=UPI0022209833|nr:uncharacterized protein BC939DRAFT_489897 [Gamsiella multidivaricata]KAG0369849.1 hypothetical protein BGZ54_008677 [Gamsiella multidivaricata]KAI7830542.1 hypothetical protein BC939DRAFT_489897 [Gamsiella multidivaricata]